MSCCESDLSVCLLIQVAPADPMSHNVHFTVVVLYICATAEFALRLIDSITESGVRLNC